MKKILIAIALCLVSFSLWAQKDYAKEWRQIDSLMGFDQPQSAQIIVDKIHTETSAQNNQPQFVKACMYRMVLKRMYEEESFVKIIEELEALIPTTVVPTKNILHSIVAEQYWNYYQQNRWSFNNHTATEVQPNDVRTWDLRLLVAKCEEHYAASLANARDLQKIKINDYKAVLEKQKESEKYRPTLFDFLAFRAVEFYNNNDANLLQPADQFVVNNEDYFAPASAFSSLIITTLDTISFKYQALKYLQQIIAFHLEDADPTALLDADLQRLDMVYAQASLAHKDSLYLAALQHLDNLYVKHPSSTEVLFRIARYYKQQGDAYHPFTKPEVQWKKKEAMALIEKAIARFPKSFGAESCLVLKNEIERPNITFTMDNAVLPNMPVLASLQYQNVKKIFFKIVALDYKEALNTRVDEKQDDYYAKAKAIHSWNVDLPELSDYQKHTVELALPELKEGYYAVLTSIDGLFTDKSILWSENKFFATNLSLVRQNKTQGDMEVMVLHRETGQPIQGVQVQTFAQIYNYDKRCYETTYRDELTTNLQGIITLPPTDVYISLGLLATYGKDCYVQADNLYMYGNSDMNRTYTNTTFFTDRAIYRPGQTVYFKGIVLKTYEYQSEKTEIVKNHKQKIFFYNVNYEKVAEQEVVTNEFGSFAGNFIIPSSGLTGVMTIQSQGANGSASIRVEEYKRPKFEVNFAPVAGSYRLNEQLTVTGTAKAYAGNALSDAKVTYRVTRQARYPYWRWWWGPIPHSPAQEITNGTLETKADGSFDISFTAIPDVTIPEKDLPVFHYTVSAIVSDINGETHEAQTIVAVGYQSLLVATDIPEKINIDEWENITINTTNLNGQPQPAKGTLTIWKLREPVRILQKRNWQRPDQFIVSRTEFEKTFPLSVYDNEDDVANWEKEQAVYTLPFDTQNNSQYTVTDAKKWEAGKYLVELKTCDAFGQPVELTSIVTGFSTAQKIVPANEIAWLEIFGNTVQSGEIVKVALGSACKNVRVLLEVNEENKISKRQYITLNNEQKIIEIPVLESYRGNFGITVFFVKDNRVYANTKTINVPYDNKKLDVELATFRDKLQPGQEEEWRITIKDKQGDAVLAELLTSMYDASLDAFVPHSWSFFPWPSKYITPSWTTDASFRIGQNTVKNSNYKWMEAPVRLYDKLRLPWAYVWEPNYATRLDEVTVVAYGITRSRAVTGAVAARESVADNKGFFDAEMSAEAAPAPSVAPTEESVQEPVQENVQQPVQIRKNFNETAFFYPQLKTNEKGETVVSFTIPEALTRWKMQGLAWTQDLKVGSISKELVTQKDLMIFTNAPRFFRENDTIYFSTKLSNISGQSLRVKTQLEFFDALTMHPVSLILKGEELTPTTNLDDGENKLLSWKLYIPEGLQAVTYRIVATSLPLGEGRGGASDGEESTIPVLTNRMLVTESLPLPIGANQSKSYEFTKLLQNNSKTLRNHAYTIEFTSNPAWYAVQALPYIMEYPYECAEQVFARYYANSIAAYIVNSDPKIKQVFDIWRNYQPNALLSNLEKNEELKSLLLEETPWVRAAHNEGERKQRVALLFDLNRMSSEMASALRKLEEAQASNGGFPWFRGGRDDRYITQHIVAGIGHLRKMTVPTKASDNMLRKAIKYIDERLAEDLKELKKQAEKNKQDYKKEEHLNYLAIHYLYARSFFLKDFPVPQATQEALSFYKTQAATYWTKQNNYMKGMLALSLHRYDDGKTAQLILRSFSETALHSEEMGMYWRNENRGWWYQAPIETQALMIELFNEIGNDAKAVNDMKTWLLKQKQTTDWKTTKATAEAVYALLISPATQAGQKVSPHSILSSDQLCEITLGGKKIDPYALDVANRPEAGTGYFKTSWKGEEVKSEMGKITVNNPNANIAWGAAYWQYFEQLDKITSAETSVKINKQLFVKTNSPTGPVLKEITSNAMIKVGDKVTVRIKIRADRDMEYVHLKDMRAAAFEPVNALSDYKWQGGLGYYESIRDAAVNFFISYLPQGTYVFEYDLFATQQGEFSNGITSLQCMYALEFTTHSEGIRITVVE
ncbi:MAG: hypothetical protein LBH91_07975 [Prevotellaceae bacterium]|jgi:uncharacterized protein YfaS (alpha-2-macroglobulin family)|nr:hypothetical protein [Prevotellaceae bacterium]